MIKVKQRRFTERLYNEQNYCVTLFKITQYNFGYAENYTYKFLFQYELLNPQYFVP